MYLNENNILSADIDNMPIDASWNQGDSKYDLMHGIHAYPAKFPPFITTKALDYAKNIGLNVDTVVDIFCGCGTVGYEALAKGKNFFGCDINPVATLISRTKCRKYDDELLTSYFEKIREKFLSIGVEIRNEYSENERISYWFDITQSHDLYKLHQAILAVVEDYEYKDFFFCAFSAILKSCSRWLTRGIKPQIDPNKKPSKVWEAFCKQVHLMKKANKTSHLDNSKQVTIKTESVLELENIQEIADLVVTSPPYVTSYEYADLHQLSTLCLGFSSDYRYFRTGSIGSLFGSRNIDVNIEEINSVANSIVMRMYSVDKRRAKSVAQYYLDMQLTVKKVKQLLRSGGLVVFVIGNTEYRGVKIDNARHLAKSLLDECFRNVEIKRRKISNKLLTPYRDEHGKFSSNKNCRKIYSEEFIIFAQK